MKENYNIINYNNKKLVVNREQIQAIKEFITYELITNKLNMFYTESLNDMEIYLDEDTDQEILRYNTQKLLEKRLKLLTQKQIEILKKYYYEGKKIKKLLNVME